MVSLTADRRAATCARPRRAAVVAPVFLSGVLLAASASHAGVKDDIGYTALADLLGASLPDGSGVVVMQVEAPVLIDQQAAWLPDPAIPELAGKNVIDVTGAAPGLYSGHAGGVARRLFGSSTSIAPGINTVYAYEANGWLGSNALRVGFAGPPLATSGRIGNHSWIGTADALDSEALRRLDWLIDTEEFVQVVGLSNGASNPPLLSAAYNVIAVGVTDGSHGAGTAGVDDLYTGDRSRPHLVVPEATTSAATPTVAAAAALLVEVAQAVPGLSTDPVSQSTTTDSGGLVYNASRSEVLKAALMAGAARRTANSTGADIVNYRQDPANQSPNGLDRRYGAGQLDVYQSFELLAAGEQNSAEDQPAGNGAVQQQGFDYDPAFGGGGGSNAQASYRLPVLSEDAEFSAALAWNLAIDGGNRFFFDGSAAPVDLDLQLLDITAGLPGVEIAVSNAGSDYNSENLWLALQGGRSYLLRVVRGNGQGSFQWDYALAWVLRELPDGDGDGVADPNDNCVLESNPDQADGDQDGFGDLCDADIDNNGIVNFADVAVLRAAFGTASASADLNSDGVVNFLDLAFLKSRFGQAPGPSGLAP